MDKLHAEVVVVGTGAAGATVAGQALRDGRSVILVEAGDDAAPGRPGRHLHNDAPLDDQLTTFAATIRAGLVNHGFVEQQSGDVGFPVVHAVGGRMTIWLNNCPEPDVEERNASISARDWPSLLDRARAALRVREHLAPGSIREQRLVERLRSALPSLPDGRGVQPMPTAATSNGTGVRFAGADDLLLGDTAELPPTAQLLSSTVARRILTQGGHVSGIEVHRRDSGLTKTVSGQVYVIAGGTIGTPQLLFASGFDQPALGTYMMDHPMFATRAQLAPEMFDGVPADDPSFSVWVPYSDQRRWHAQLSRTPSLAELDGVPDRLTADLFTFSGATPRVENRLVFDFERLDQFGLPTHESRFALTDDDWNRVDDMVVDHFHMLRSIGVVGGGWNSWLGPWGSSLHLMGTYRMGSRDDGTSVADSHSRVWGYDNLYVGGNGLLSERNACNPTLQTVALALRSVDHMLGRDLHDSEAVELPTAAAAARGG